MKRLKPAGRFTPLWLVMGLFAAAGCGSAGSPPAEDTQLQTVSGALESYGPDLVVTEVHAPPSVRPGQPFTATVKVCNRGTDPATTWYNQVWLELYLSLDADLSLPGPGTPPPNDQRFLGGVDVPPLDPGQCTTRTLQAYASLPPDAQGDGAYYVGAIVDVSQSLQEADETNNAHVAGLMGVGYRADLVVTEVKGPASVRPGQPFAATVQVCNQGTEPTSGHAGQPRVELYLSTDADLSLPGPGTPPPNDQRMVGSVDVPHLGAGQCVTRTVNAFSSLPPDAQGDGAYYLGAIVDAYQAEQELREDNNSFIGGLVGVGYRADLVVTEVKGPASVHHGDSFMATVKVCNQGTEPTSGYSQSYLELYLSMDTTLTPPLMPGPGSPLPTDQRMVGHLAVPSLNAGQCATRTVMASAWLPQDAQGDGAYFLGAIVDAHPSEQELREDNNSLVGGLVGVGHRADLVVTEVKGPASVRQGDPFTATVKVCNQGTQPSSYQSTVELYLSMDTTLTPPQLSGPWTPPPSDQRFIGVVQLPSLATGQCLSQTFNAYAHAPQAADPDGAFYLGAIVDPFQSEPELREDNNILVGGLMGVGYRADLVVTEVRGPISIQPGTPFTASVKVCNQGTETTGGWYGGPRVELYLSTDTTLSASGPGTPPTDQRLIGFVDLPQLNAGQCVTRDMSAHAFMPQDFPGEGALYLGAIVDPFQTVQELREDNNAFVGGLMGVGYRADLVVTQVSGPASVHHGEPFTARVKVCNQGTEYSGAIHGTWLELYLSTDTTLTAPVMSGPGMPPPTDQRRIGSMNVPSLSAGQCVTLDVGAHAFLPPDAMGDGAYSLGAIVDPFQSVPELREDNNTFIGGLMGVGELPDLVVAEVKGPASVRQGESFTATVKVCNQGTQPAGYSSWPSVSLYLSMDDTLSFPPMGGPGTQLTEQRMVASESLPPLQPGECTTRSMLAYTFLPADAQGEGPVFLGAIVDDFVSVPELREDNNTRVGGLMGVGDRSDLVVTEVRAPASVRPGDTFTASVKVCNQGTVRSGLYAPGMPRVDLYLSPGTALVIPEPGMPYPHPESQQLIGSTEVAPLDAGQCVTLSLPAFAHVPPGAQDLGALFLGAIVDASRMEPELREDNNAHPGGLVGVGLLSDLVVTEVSGPASAQRGMPFTAQVKVCNQGTEPSNAYGTTRLEVYLSTEASLTVPGPGMPPPQGSQMRVGSLDLVPLVPGQCETLAVQASAQPPPEAPWDGAVFLGAIVDVHGAVSELREDNNVTVGGRMGVGERPDLVVTAVSAPTSVHHGDAFTASVTVCNQGTTPSGYPYGGTLLGLFLSTDTTLSPMGPGPMPMDQGMVGSVQLDPLAPGQCTTVSVQAGAYPPPASQGAGSFFLGAYVDPYLSEYELREDNNARADLAFEVTW